MPDLRLSFYGDDFTGSTDAMESLARSGLRTILFTAPPTRQQLAQYPDLRAFGIAGMTRSMRPDEMERTLRPVFSALRELGAPIVHYKVCSTFDSSPTVGSIGKVIDIGAELFDMPCVPVLVGAPALGRYCVFGNLFARAGTESEPFRLDRHPSMSHHPTTPMDEADLRLHLAKQTRKRIGLLDVLQLNQDLDAIRAAFRAQLSTNEILLIDLLYEQQLATVGRLIAEQAAEDPPLLVVGSSGVESALAAHWGFSARPFPSPGEAGPMVAICGSCSPVTERQIQHAVAGGFVEINDLEQALREGIAALKKGQSIVIHSRKVRGLDSNAIGSTLGQILRNLLSEATIRRVLIAGGDTSGAIARDLGIESMEMIAELTRGAPLVRVSAPRSPADGIEMVFKGGQIGPQDFFCQVQKGT